MQISVENTGQLERKLTVSVPAASLDDAVRSRLQQLSREVRLKGFRPGKVPMAVVEKRFGAQVREEAMGELVRDSFGEALRQENLRPAMSPRITPVPDAAEGELAFTAEFEVLPELGTIDISGLKIDQIKAEVVDADIDTMIDTLRQQRRTWNTVERAAADGDLVMFEYSAQADDARFPAEGRERAGTVIGAGGLPPDFEQALVGLSVDDEKRFLVDFPEGWQHRDLAGKQAQIELRVLRIQASHVPEVDEEFIASFGIPGGELEQFRADVRANLERELSNAVTVRLKGEVIKQLLAANADLVVPRGMVEAEAESMHQSAERQRRQAGPNAPAVPPVAEFVNTATDRVRAAVLIGELARQNGIRLDERRVREMLATIASTYEEPEQLIQLYTSNQNLMQGLQQRVIEDQVAEWVSTQAPGETRELSFSEVMKPQT